MNRLAKDESGATIVEVLVAVVLFALAFGIGISLLDIGLGRVSVRETRSASELASRLLEETLASKVTTALDSVVTINGLRLRARRTTTFDGGLTSVAILVIRESTGKILLETYGVLAVEE